MDSPLYPHMHATFLPCRTCLMTFSFITFTQMCDILVVNKNYDAEGPDSISVRVGDLVEVLETGEKTIDEPNAKWVCAPRSGNYL